MKDFKFLDVSFEGDFFPFLEKVTCNSKGVSTFLCTQFDVLNFFRLVTKIDDGRDDSEIYTNHEENPLL